MLLERIPIGANRLGRCPVAETPCGVFGNPFTSSTHVTPLLIRSSCAYRHSIFKEQTKKRPPVPLSSISRIGQGDGLSLPPSGLFPEVSPNRFATLAARLERVNTGRKFFSLTCLALLSQGSPPIQRTSGHSSGTQPGSARGISSFFETAFLRCFLDIWRPSQAGHRSWRGALPVGSSPCTPRIRASAGGAARARTVPDRRRFDAALGLFCSCFVHV